VCEREGEREYVSSAFLTVCYARTKREILIFFLLFHFRILDKVDDVEVIGIREGKLDANQCEIIFNLRSLPHTK